MPMPQNNANALLLHDTHTNKSVQVEMTNKIRTPDESYLSNVNVGLTKTVGQGRILHFVGGKYERHQLIVAINHRYAQQ